MGGYSTQTTIREISTDPRTFEEIITLEGFLYTFVQSGKECEVRHQYWIEKLDLGVQAVAFSDSYIWAAGGSTGLDIDSISTKSSILFRARKDNPEQELEVFIVDFKGQPELKLVMGQGE